MEGGQIWYIKQCQSFDKVPFNCMHLKEPKPRSKKLRYTCKELHISTDYSEKVKLIPGA